MKLINTFDKEKFLQYCKEIFETDIDERAALYFIRLLERKMNEFKKYLPQNRKIRLEDIWKAAGEVFD